MGWLFTVTITKSVFLTLVHVFYSKMRYRYGGLVTSNVRGVKIQLDPNSINYIFNSSTIGIKIYEAKA